MPANESQDGHSSGIAGAGSALRGEKEMAGRRSGSLIRRGEKKWLVRWYLGDDNGRKRYASKRIRGSKRDAQRYLNERLRSQDLGQDTTPTKETLNSHLDAWLGIAWVGLRTPSPAS